MRKNIFFIVFIILCAVSCTEKKSNFINTVHLKGQLFDMGSQNVRMRFDGAASMLGDSRDILLKTDAAGYFDTTFVLKEPTYYTISRNTLYLTPGDDMTIKVTQTNTEAEFSGIGAEANNYMKFRLFPKGGSYLEAGGNLRGDFVSTLKSATKPLNVLIAFTRPLITEFADNLNLKHPLLPTISPYPTM